MKTAIAILVIVAIVGQSAALKVGKPVITKIENGQMTRLTSATVPKSDKLCPVCVSFLDQAIDQLLNIILNAGVIGGCGDICSKLPNKAEATVCDLLCDYVGVKEFIALIQKADIDPIYMCELMKICPIHDGGAANITALTIDPAKGPQGTQFNIRMVFQVTKETGTGETTVLILPPGGMPIGTGELNLGFQPGTYGVQWGLKTQPNEDEPFNPGTYKVETAVCYGECGSKHPHSDVLSVKKGSFDITQQQ